MAGQRNPLLVPERKRVAKVGEREKLQLRRSASDPDGSPLLEAFAAIHRTPLRWLEGNRGLFSALRTDRFGLHSLYVTRTRLAPLSAVCLARLAPLRLVFEALVGEKHLLAGGKNELRSTLSTLQDLIVIFHALPPSRVRARRAAKRLSFRVRFSV